MESLIEKNSRASLPMAELSDKASDRLRKLIERKRKRDEDIVTSPGKAKRKAEVVDLLDVLRQSLGQAGKSTLQRSK